MRIVQLLAKPNKRAIAVVEGDRLRLVPGFTSAHQAALAALEGKQPLSKLLADNAGSESLDYDEIWSGRGSWSLLPCFDHPEEPSRCLVSGTGLTHLKGAENRNSMHKETQTVTDSMRMYQWGVEGGRPVAGQFGKAPEWFYKGSGSILRGHLAELEVPWFGEDGGEEPEIAGAYVIDREGNPRRVGMCVGNEFSDHMMERQNYLYLAPSKMRVCSIGPELVLDPDFSDVRGTARVLRDDKVIWEKGLATGENNMCHSLANMEHHHFKYPAHRQPGDVHIHYFGAGAFSFGDGVALQPGDTMEVSFDNFGRPLRNTLLVDSASPALVEVLSV